MGDFRVRKIINEQDRCKMYRHALKDIKVFEHMLAENSFDTGPIKIGAEQELCIVGPHFDPAISALELLDEIDDPHYTNELALFNLEINLDPLNLSGDCFSQMEKDLLALLQKGKAIASKREAQLLLTGILPTLKYRHLHFDFMTPVKRYQTLSKELSAIRGEKFEIYLQGVDDLMMSLGSVLFEACNTSFQLHLQVDPSDFVARHNWAQMISGPVLAACTNSPILFGKELWAETRIALFKQSLDTRSSQKHLRKKLPRVYFGKDWLKESAAELWKNDLMRFPLIVTSDDFQDAEAVLKKGGTPNLRAIRLHNGTTYTWNRLCYGTAGNKPHLRIECRYLPSGPSAIDEIANFAFWIGLMKHGAPDGSDFWKKVDFRIAKNNFIKAARTGLNSVFNWFGKQLSAKQLILEALLPMAAKGLKDSSVDEADINKYLSLIEQRVKAEITGSSWCVDNFRALSKYYGAVEAQRMMVEHSLHYQNENVPLHEWEAIKPKKRETHKQASLKVEHQMTTDMHVIHEHDSIELAKAILTWNNIHHLPVENDDGDLVGLITDGMMDRIKENKTEGVLLARDIMLKEIITVQAGDQLSFAKKVLENKKLSGLPVVYQNKLVGIITERDF